MKPVVMTKPSRWMTRLSWRLPRVSARLSPLVARQSLRMSLSPVAKRLRCPSVCATHRSAEPATTAEEIANRQRWEESGKCEGSADAWRWTLNWDEVLDNVIVGSCPRSIEDVDSIVDEAGATAILSVQSDLCLDALKIDYPTLRNHGLCRGIMMTRIPIRDFDHGDQALMLPEAVRTLALLTALNHRVYVHCTAGINRASLTVLGYLTFVQVSSNYASDMEKPLFYEGWDLNSALKEIKDSRPQANPYIDSWKQSKTRLLEGRSEEVIALSRKLFLKNENGQQEDSFSNWYAAEDLVIKETFRRLLSNSIETITALTDLKATSLCSVCVSPDDFDRANKEIEDLQYELTVQRQRLAEATASLNAQKTEPTEHLGTLPSYKDRGYKMNGNASALDALDHSHIDMPGSSLMVYDELLRVKKEVGELKKHIREIAMISTEALSIDTETVYGEEWDGADEDDEDNTVDQQEEETKDEEQ